MEMSCAAIAKVLYLDDDTIRYWYQLYGEKGLSWLADFGYDLIARLRYRLFGRNRGDPCPLVPPELRRRFLP